MFARILNGRVVELLDYASLDGRFTAAFIDTCTPCDGSVEVGMTWDGESFSALPARTAEEIKKELAALDPYLPRAVEDIIEAEEVMDMVSIDGAVTTYDKLSGENQARLATKRALRAELAALESGD